MSRHLIRCASKTLNIDYVWIIFLKLSSRNIWGDYLLKLDGSILLQKEDDNKEEMMAKNIE